MILNQEKTDKLLELLRKRYPRWSGFSDQRFARDPAALRPESLEGAELLNEAGLRQLLGERRWDEIIGRIDFVARSASSASPNGPDMAELAKLHEPKMDKEAFCAAVIDLMFGDGESAVRLQRFADAAAKRGFPRGWSLPTLLLMLVHPFTDCLVKPDAFKWFLGFAGHPFALGELNGETYGRILKLAREVAIHFEDGSMVEMPVIQRLIWLCFSESGEAVPAVEALASPAEEAPATATIVTETVIEADEPAAVETEAVSAPAPEESFKIINIDKESEDAHRVRAKKHKECAVDEPAFDLLESIARGPVTQKIDKAQREAALERPMLALVREAMARVPERVRTQFFSVPLTASGSDRAHGFFNVSFYRKGGKWRGEPQLFFTLTEEGLECGYSIEWFMGLYLERFRANFTRNEALMVAWLEEVAVDQIPLKAGRVKIADGSNAFRAESFVGENQEIRVSITMPKDRVVGWSRTRLAGSIAEALTRLFPVLQLALDEDPFTERPEKRAEDVAPITAAAEAAAAVAAAQPEAVDDEERAPMLETELPDDEAEAPAPQAAPVAVAPVFEVVVPDVAKADESDDEGADWREPDETEAEPAAEAPAAPAEPVEKPAPEKRKDEKPANLLDVLAREVEGRSWTEAARGASLPARRPDVEVGGASRAAAHAAAEAAVMEEFEVLGIHHRQNPAFPLPQCAEETGFSESQLREWTSALDRKGQAVFYGPPGTGKTFMAEKLARHLIGGSDGFSRLVQMHRGLSYEDFIEARRPAAALGREARTISVPGRFVEFCREAEARSGLCVLILDEMHRADIGNVVGELLYLLEHRDQEIQLSGGTRFRVPSNVRVIGTMNTADRSNAFLDSAIRRRFAFLELGPRYDVLRHFHRNNAAMPVEGLVSVLETLNRRIANKRFEVGIAYFLRANAHTTLASVWATEIQPLIEDYFFDQPGAADAFAWSAVKSQLAL